MLKSCPYCGRIHDSRFDCGKKPKRTKWTGKGCSQLDAFRGSKSWQRMRETIRARDRSLCRWCLAYGTLTCSGLSVHHIEPLAEAWELRLEESNLITLCGQCHEMAEAGKIPRAMLHDLTSQPPQLSPRCQQGKNPSLWDTDAGPRKTKDSRNEN